MMFDLQISVSQDSCPMILIKTFSNNAAPLVMWLLKYSKKTDTEKRQIYSALDLCFSIC